MPQRGHGPRLWRRRPESAERTTAGHHRRLRGALIRIRGVWEVLMIEVGMRSHQVGKAVPADVLITPPPPSEEDACTGTETIDEVRIGIACMTKKPTSFDRWLRWHREALGVERFYLRVEDTPDLEPLLTSAPWADLVDATFHTGTVRDWSGQTNRQGQHVDQAIGKALRDGLTHLLHIDDDEMIFAPGGLAALRRTLRLATASGAFNLHALNLEAIAPAASAEALGKSADSDASTGDEHWCHFAECRAFRHSRKAYGAYGGNPLSAGKSFGTLTAPRLRMSSPHHFASSRDRGGAHCGNMHGSVILQPHTCVVLHYESCSYPRWQRKFCDYARRHLDSVIRQEEFHKLLTFSHGMEGHFHHNFYTLLELGDPGFVMYQESMHACVRLVRALDTHPRYPPHAKEAEEQCRSVWTKWKVEPEGLPPLEAAFDRERPQILHEVGITLIPPLVDGATGQVRLPPGHLDGLDSRAGRPPEATLADGVAAGKVLIEISA